jgi:putative endonuclease
VKHYVYMLKCKDDSLYTGYTTDVNRRLSMHEQGRGAKYTRGRGPFQVVYVEECTDKSLAMRREAAIKRLTTAQKRELASSNALTLLKDEQEIE